ncbi:unnamed protein product, partial [Owenia fusiformis]
MFLFFELVSWMVRDSHESWNNKFEVVPTGLFSRLSHIVSIDLSQNRIIEIQRNAFLDNYELMYLNVSFNDLQSVDTYIFELIGKAQGETHKVFDFSHNNLESFHNYNGKVRQDFRNKKYLAFMDLKYNQFKYINLDLFRPFSLTTLDGWLQFIITTLAVQAQLFADFSKNPITCDCNMFDVQRMLKLIKRHTSLPKWLSPTSLGNSSQLARFIFWEEHSLVCMYPPELHGSKLSLVNAGDLVCDVTDGCPVYCRCIRSPSLKRLIIECSNKHLTGLPPTLPRVQSDNEKINIYVRDNYIEDLQYRSYFNDVAILDVSHNQIKSIDSAAIENLTNLEQLILYNNNLEYLPKRLPLVKNLKNISLHGNPLVCSCNTVWIKAWLRSLTDRYVLHKSRKITCVGETEPIIEREVHVDLCNVNFGVVVVIPVCSMILFIFIPMTLFCFKDVLILLIRKQTEYPEHPEDKQYDAF